jgi:uncharacterized protein
VKNSVFVDTGAFVALADEDDQFHVRAVRAGKEAEKSGHRLTTDFVLMETCLYLQRRLSPASARRFWGSILSGDAGVELARVESPDLERARDIADQYADQDFSIVDCVSFAVMERLKMSRVFSFDHHFDVFRPSTGRWERFP